MAKQPKVSVVIPTRNEEKYLGKALSSLRRQDYGGLEIIIGDAGSTDRTAQISRRYKARVVVEPKPTIAAGRQKAALAASGDILVHADADATFPPNMVSELVAPFSDPSVVAVVGKLIPSDGSWLEKLVCEHVLGFLIWSLNSLGITYVYGGSLAVRASAFRKINGFNTDLVTAEDTDLVKRIRRHGKLAYNPKAIAYFSMRRVRGWGYPRYILYHTKNFFMSNFFNTSQKGYEPVR